MPPLNKTDKIVISGAAGLVGQNLVSELSEQGYANILALDKHQKNLDILHERHPFITSVRADLSSPGPWRDSLAGAARLFLLQAQITGGQYDVFQRNTIDSTRNVLDAAKERGVDFTIFTGSSVVHSVADDNYTRSKIAQEALVRQSRLKHCIVRPTLMFGWFDPKHLGWLSRFMGKAPFFPIPGHGRYIRQPLYVRDFCRVLIWCAENSPDKKAYDIVGQEAVSYVDIVRHIKRVKKLKTPIIHLPVPLFRLLMRAYAFVSKNPPFVEDQLDALMAGDCFTGEDMYARFGIEPTPFAAAVEETFTHPVYSRVILER